MKQIKLLSFLFPLFLLSFALNAQNNAASSRVEYGNAVFYADYLHGQSTAMNEYYLVDQMTAAHKYHPKGTLLKVSRLDNGQSVVVRVNDKGPYSQGCIVDVSRVAAQKLGLIKDGKIKVAVEVIGYSDINPPASGAAQKSQMTTKGTSSSNTYAPLPNTYDTRARASTNRATTTVKSGDLTQNTASQVKFMDPAQTGYAVQVASYRDYSNAERQVRAYQDQGIEYLYLKEARSREGHKLYKLVIAPFSSKAKAQNYLSELRNRYSLDGIVVVLR